MDPDTLIGFLVSELGENLFPLFEVTKFGLSATDNEYRWSKLERTIKSILSNFFILQTGKNGARKGKPAGLMSQNSSRD